MQLHTRDIFFSAIDSPSLPPSLIGSPSSRRNVIVGAGEPVAVGKFELKFSCNSLIFILLAMKIEKKDFT